ncbi:MAG: hypothetical protein GY804_14425 [Alphaproteobacteria bacterium]|nr:hypothetical protein [Alphaproteobacteria bacterium]
MFNKNEKFANQETGEGYVVKNNVWLLREGYTDKKKRLTFDSREMINPPTAKILNQEFQGHIIESVNLTQGGVEYIIEYSMISLRLVGKRITEKESRAMSPTEINDMVNHINVSKMMRDKAAAMAKEKGKKGTAGGGAAGGSDLSMVNSAGGRE